MGGGYIASLEMILRPVLRDYGHLREPDTRCRRCVVEDSWAGCGVGVFAVDGLPMTPTADRCSRRGYQQWRGAHNAQWSSAAIEEVGIGGGAWVEVCRARRLREQKCTSEAGQAGWW